MARTSTDWDDEENLAKWRRLGDLGYEEGLREGGCSEETIADFCKIDGHFLPSSKDRAVILALVGRTTNGTGRKIPSLVLQRATGNEVAALCVNLASNTDIEKLYLLDGSTAFSTVKGCTLLGKALRTNSTLQHLDLSAVEMDRYAVKFLMDELQENTTLVSLDLRDNPLFDEGTKLVAEFLRRNRSLKRLDISSVGFGFEGASYIASALETNTTLERLTLGSPNPFERAVLKKLLEPFSHDVRDETGRESEMPSEVQKNTTVKTLILHHKGYFYSPEELTWLIKTNKSLSRLKLHGAALAPEQWKDKIFPAFKENKTLLDLELMFCQGLTGKDVQDALIRLLQSTKIGLTTLVIFGWKPELGPDFQRRVEEELRKNSEYRIKLRDQPIVQGKSGRLILCGFGYAGKTSICNTMKAIDQGISRSYSFKTFWKKAMQTFPGLQRLLFGKDAYKHITGRTRGFDVVSLKRQQYLKFIWDFAGQKAYYALHDYMFPDTKNSCFLYVCSCRCPPSAENLKGAIKSKDAMKGELEFWMKFIVSNSEPHSDRLSQVRFVLTKRDTLSSRELSISSQWAQQVVSELATVFTDVLKLCEIVEVVDTHSLQDVSRLLTLTDESLKEVLKHQTEYALCEDVRHALAKQPSHSAIMTCHDFYSISEGRFRFEDSPEETRQAILAYLNDLGEVIFPKGFDFVVTNPRWFGVRVLGSLIDSFKGVEGGAQPTCTNLCCLQMEPFGLDHEKGIVARSAVKRLLENSLQMADLQQTISFEKLIDLMIHLELCFESQPGNENSPLFLPALFDDDKEEAANGQRQLKWKLEEMGRFHYFGRRLECHDKATTFLTPGFFPRLQVYLRNYFHENHWTENPGFVVDRNLIGFARDRVEVLVEYSGDIDYFIDVLVRSSKSPAEALEFVGEHVIKKIQDFCFLQKGCQGVRLVEAVIRKVCVEELYLCKDRKEHSILVSTLKADLEKEGPAFKHIWSHSIVDQDGDDSALGLLEEDHPTTNLVQSLEISSSAASCSSSVASSSSHNNEFPTLFYPSIEDVGILARLNIGLNLSKKMSIKLHLMCDHKDGHHVLDNQPGRTISLNWKAGGYDVPILKLALTLLWTGVGVASSMTGGPRTVLKVDSWIQNLLNVCEIPNIDVETLQEMMNRGKTRKPVTEQDILKALERYWKLDPESQGLTCILNVQDINEFRKDFQLRKVVYTEPPHQNKIGWVCDRHYLLELKERNLRLGKHRSS